MSESASDAFARLSPFVFGGLSIYQSHYLSIQNGSGSFSTSFQAIGGVVGVGLIMMGVGFEVERWRGADE